MHARFSLETGLRRTARVSSWETSSLLGCCSGAKLGVCFEVETRGVPEQLWVPGIQWPFPHAPKCGPGVSLLGVGVAHRVRVPIQLRWVLWPLPSPIPSFGHFSGRSDSPWARLPGAGLPGPARPPGEARCFSVAVDPTCTS